MYVENYDSSWVRCMTTHPTRGMRSHWNKYLQVHCPGGKISFKADKLNLPMLFLRKCLVNNTYKTSNYNEANIDIDYLYLVLGTQICVSSYLLSSLVKNILCDREWFVNFTVLSAF